MLPAAIQDFGIDAGNYLAGIDEMLDWTDQLAKSLDSVVASADRMGKSLAAASAQADAGLSSVSDAAVRLAETGGKAAEAETALADAGRAAADAQLSLLDIINQETEAARTGAGIQGELFDAIDLAAKSARGAAEAEQLLADAEKAAADAAAFEAGLLADLDAQQKLLAGGAKILADSLAAEARAMKVAGDSAALAGTETAAAGDESVIAGDKAEVAGGKAEAAGGMWKTAMLGVAIALGYGIDKAAGFQSSMEQLHTQAGVAQSKLAGLSQGVLQLAGQVGQGPQSLAESLYHVESNMASMGATSATVMSAVKVAAEGAQVGGANLVDVTNALTAAIASGIPGVQNFQQAMGMLNATVGSGDMHMQDLADAFSTGLLAVVKGYGITLKDTGAALATFGDNNIRGAKAGTDFRMAVQALAVPVATAKTQLAALGLTQTSLAKDMQSGGLMKALDDLTGKFKANGVTAKTEGEVITTLFGKKAGSGIAVLLEQMDRLKSKYPAITEAASNFAGDWASRTKTMAQQWDDLKSGAQALAISFGSMLLPAATKIVQSLTGFTNFLEKHPMLAEFAGGILALAVAFKVAATAEALFSAVTAADPLTWILVAVIAAAAGLYLLYTRFKTVRDAVADVAAFLKSAWSDAVKAAGAVTTWFANGPLAWVKSQLALFASFWAQHGAEIVQIATTVWHAIADVVTEQWRILWDLVIHPGLVALESTWRTVWGLVTDTALLSWRTITAVISAAVHIILDVIAVALDLLTGHWSQAWSDCKKLVHDAIYGISNIIHTFTAGAITLLIDAGKNIVMGLIHGIESMAGGAYDAIKSIGSGLLHSAESALGINSPSRVFFDVGSSVTEGFANGINATAGRVYSAARTLAANVAAIANAAATGHATISALPTPAAVTSSAIVSALPTPSPATTAAAALKAALAGMGGGGTGGGGAGSGGTGSDPYTTAAKTAAKAVAAATAAQAAEYAKIGAGITDRIGAGITETIPQARIAALKLTEAIRRELAERKITSAEASELTTKIQEDLTARAHRLVKAMQQISLEMRAGLLSSLENAATRAQANSAVTKLIDYVKTAWSAGDISLSKASSMTSWLEADNSRLENLAQKRQKLEATIKAAGAYANTTTSNTESWAGLGNITSSMTSGGMTYSGNILSGMQADLSSIRRFGDAVKRLGREGLSKNLLNQIIQMGPDQGLQVATALLDGPLSVIRSMNATQSAINSASSGLGQTAANLMYDSGQMAGKGFLSGLQAQQKNITKMMDEIAKSMIEVIEKDLKIHSPSLVTTEHGEMIAMGLINGMQHGAPGVRNAAHMLAAASMPGGGQGGGAGGGSTGNVTINIDVHVPGGFIGNEEQLARELEPAFRSVILQYARRNGHNGLNLPF